jgi:predicted dehydrogenase
MSKPPFTRRDFIRHTAAGAASAGAAVGALAATAKGLGPNGRLRVAFLGTGLRGQAHIDAVLRLAAEGQNIEAVAVCDVYSRNREQAAERIAAARGGQSAGGFRPRVTGDYRELLDDPAIDAVCIATPDHWHARMTIDALDAGKHVYCERPMTHTIDESQQVLAAWRQSGRVMQVGVQGTADGRWRAAHEFIRQGGIGKVVQVQTEAFRNSAQGQWRSIGLARDMTPRNIDWPMFLGSEFGLAPPMPFDRARFAQWRCYWPTGSGLFGELFVPQLTRMLSAAGLAWPWRVMGGGGIFLEYDGRDVPDTATIVADYDEGVQALITATLCCDHKVEQCIRGRHGAVVFDLSREGFDFLPQRPQVTRLRDARKQHFDAPRPADETSAHWRNFLEAVAAGDPTLCHNTPELGAAAVVTVQMGAQSYLAGKALEWDSAAGRIVPSGEHFARQWEQRSREGAAPRHIAGWAPAPADSPGGEPAATDTRFSRPQPGDYQKLAGPWTDDESDPAAGV